MISSGLRTLCVLSVCGASSLHGRVSVFPGNRGHVYLLWLFITDRWVKLSTVDFSPRGWESSSFWTAGEMVVPSSHNIFIQRTADSIKNRLGSISSPGVLIRNLLLHPRNDQSATGNHQGDAYFRKFIPTFPAPAKPP